jgi:hypothetical protein
MVPICSLDTKGTADMVEYVVTIEGHQVVAQLAYYRPSHLYIDGELRDTYTPDGYNPWDPYNLWCEGLFALKWKTILRGQIVRTDGETALVEFQIKSGLDDVYDRILFAGKVMKRWKNKRG